MHGDIDKEEEKKKDVKNRDFFQEWEEESCITKRKSRQVMRYVRNYIIINLYQIYEN